jgi:DNA-binding MarR family transcriptional regulator
MPKIVRKTIEQKLDTAIELLQHLVALELARAGVPKQTIAKHIRVATATIVKMLKGVKAND